MRPSPIPPKRSHRPGSVVALAPLLVVAMTVGLVTAPSAGATRRTTRDRCFIEAAYETFLDRAPSDQELERWVQRFTDGVPPSSLARNLAVSEEWLSAAVQDLYRKALDRPAEPSGLEFWLTLLSQGAPLRHIASEVYASQEYHKAAGGADEGFVSALYRTILQRDPDPGGLAYWTDQVDTRGRAGVVSAFFASVESRTVRVVSLYQRVLGRSPEPAGLAFWVGALSHRNDLALTVDLAVSAEFYAVAQTRCDRPTIERITDGDAAASDPAVSADGRYVAFSSASPLAGPDPNDGDDIFLTDLVADETTRVTAGDAASSDPVISADGSWVAFNSSASDLVDDDAGDGVFLWERATGEITRVSAAETSLGGPDISASGRYVTFSAIEADVAEEAPTSLISQIFSWDRTTSEITRVTQSGEGAFGNDESFTPSITSDGDEILFTSLASSGGSFDIFAWDRASGSITEVTAFNDSTTLSDISADGDTVVFESKATDFPGSYSAPDSELYVLDRDSGDITPLPGSDPFGGPAAVSAKGTRIAFSSADPSLAGDESDDIADVFIWDRAKDRLARVTDGDGPSRGSAIGADGSVVAFSSAASDLVPDDDNGATDIFVWRPAEATGG